jgi:DNA repair protein RadC
MVCATCPAEGCFREIVTPISFGFLVHGERTLQKDRMWSAAAGESRRVGLRICEMESSQRPRERLLEFGPTVLSDAELIAVLLRTGRRGHGAAVTAQELLAEVGGVAGVSRLCVQDLVRRPGIGPAKAATLLAAVELGSRLAGAELRRGERLDRPEGAATYLACRLKSERQEVFGVLCLDSRHRLLASHRLTVGTRTQAPVDTAEVFRRALLDDAAGLVLYHNHPSGDLDPSRDDLALTRRLARAGDTMGVTVLDHLIVAGSRWLSLRSVRPGLFVGSDRGGD